MPFQRQFRAFSGNEAVCNGHFGNNNHFYPLTDISARDFLNYDTILYILAQIFTLWKKIHQYILANLAAENHNIQP